MTLALRSEPAAVASGGVLTGQWPVEETVRHGFKYIDFQLVPEDARSKIHDLSRMFLGGFSSFGFECPLSVAHPEVGFSLCSEPPPYNQPAPAGSIPAFGFTGDHPVWRSLIQFFGAWTACGMPDNIRCVWLEFDCREALSDNSVPGFFFGRRQNSAIPPDALHGAGEHHYQTTIGILKLFDELIITNETMHTLHRCFSLLPFGAEVVQTGIMFSREPQTLRLCIEIPKEHVETYCHGIGWPGSFIRLGGLLKRYGKYPERIRIDLDIVGKLMPNLGLECFFPTLPAEQSLTDFIDALTGERVILEQYRNQLLAWQGPSVEIYHNGPPAVFWRRLSHIKLTCRDNESVTAKAYLWFGPREIPTGIADREDNRPD